jgi:hypothetical protein
VEVRQTWTRLVGLAKERLRNTFENELPPILSGLDATAIQKAILKARGRFGGTVMQAGHGLRGGVKIFS